MLYFPASHFSPAEVQEQLNMNCYIVTHSRKEGGRCSYGSEPSRPQGHPKAAPCFRNRPKRKHRGQTAALCLRSFPQPPTSRAVKRQGSGHRTEAVHAGALGAACSVSSSRQAPCSALHPKHIPRKLLLSFLITRPCAAAMANTGQADRPG